jgi:peptidoglycan hydrolase CwlO-like protein
VRRASRRRDLLLAIIALSALVGGSAIAAPTPQDLQNNISGVQNHERAVREKAAADSARVNAVQARIDDVQVRLDALEESFAIEKALLNRLQRELRFARARYAALQVKLARDRQALREQLVAAYESPSPDITTVVLNSRGFADLIERVDVLKRIQRENARTTADVRDAHANVGRQAHRLAEVEGRQQKITGAVYAQRQEAAALRHDLVVKRQHFARSRAAKNAALASLRSHRKHLEGELSKIYGSSSGEFLGHGGLYGFFQYPGTNYSVGDTPTLAKRLDALGKALGLHLIGISGYRTPQHSVEVGGFANDPHTQGKASDTPGIEGVSESTLNQYGLTRPFGGSREADHIQLVGSI